MRDNVSPLAEQQRRHLAWMQRALAQARLAIERGEAPIGCVLYRDDGTMIAEAHNTMMSSGIVTAHAEMNAFAAAGRGIAPGVRVIMVSTLEPCVMCTGAAMQAGVVKIVYALPAPADAGTGRVRPPESPGSTAPDIVGRVGADDSRALFEQWLTLHAGDESRRDQREFVEQLLALTDNDDRVGPLAQKSSPSG
ncbi:nucleoside deaminase [Gemmatimonas groenlandica]|uniref:Nucleoside deaminase n=1 Tax=Gemmatimonas groenlandica TaxID=2732249 RepID=A0A6M4INP4_9BACT|nr:nucleoside deaminase [Gemmatimonas groenlandica]